MEKRTIAILGATGSIGTQALDIVRRYPDRFEAAALVAHSSAEKLFDLVREFRPKVAALSVEPEYIPDDVKEIMLKEAVKLGYDTSKLIWVDQTANLR